MAMKNFGIMDALKTAVEDKKEASSREVSGWYHLTRLLACPLSHRISSHHIAALLLYHCTPYGFTESNSSTS